MRDLGSFKRGRPGQGNAQNNDDKIELPQTQATSLYIQIALHIWVNPQAQQSLYLSLSLSPTFRLFLSLKLPEIEIEIETHLSKTRTFQLAS